MTHSTEYQNILKAMHSGKQTWGVRTEIPEKVRYCIEHYKIKSILDFGCAEGKVIAAIKEEYPHLETYGYDPAYNTFMPEKVDMIMSTDVLEHIEPEEIDNTITDLRNRAEIIQYHLIACHQAKKFLPDGRNAHLIQQTPDWWQRKFDQWEWEWEFENAYAFVKQYKKGRPLAQTYYELIVKKK